MSSIALVVSSLSWWESHRGRLINEAINRPILTVKITAESIASPLKEGSNTIVKSLFTTTEINNLGKTSATIDKVIHFRWFFNRDKCTLQTEIPGAPSFDEMLKGREAVPNVASKFVEAFTIPPECKEEEVAFSFSGTIYYTDTTTRIPYTQHFFEIVEAPNPSHETIKAPTKPSGP
jgi:hypothetical protein